MLTENWSRLRGVFALEGLDPSGWSAADRCSLTYRMLVREASGDALRGLYDLVDDREAVAAFDRDRMGQGEQVEIAETPKVRR